MTDLPIYTVDLQGEFIGICFCLDPGGSLELRSTACDLPVRELVVRRKPNILVSMAGDDHLGFPIDEGIVPCFAAAEAEMVVTTFGIIGDSFLAPAEWDMAKNQAVGSVTKF